MSLEKLREEIDQLDQDLLKILSKRKETIKKISQIKQVTNLPLKDLIREREMFTQREQLAQEYNLNPQFIENLFKLIINQSIKEQKGSEK